MAERSSGSGDPPEVAVLIECFHIGFRTRALGQRSGLVTPWGGGVWGLMRSLRHGGPQTVPELARARPVARQRIQKLADGLVVDGLAQFIENPRHKRSRLLQLTAAGEREFDRLNKVAHRMAARLVAGIPAQDVRTAARVLVHMSTTAANLLEEDD